MELTGYSSDQHVVESTGSNCATLTVQLNCSPARRGEEVRETAHGMAPSIGGVPALLLVLAAAVLT